MYGIIYTYMYIGVILIPQAGMSMYVNDSLHISHPLEFRAVAEVAISATFCVFENLQLPATFRNFPQLSATFRNFPQLSAIYF